MEKKGRMSKMKQKNKNHKVFHASNVSNIRKICGVLGFWIMKKQLKIKKNLPINPDINEQIFKQLTPLLKQSLLMSPAWCLALSFVQHNRNL